MAFLYVVLAMSLDLVAGHAGSLSMCHAGFYGLGAYTSAILTVDCGIPVWLGVLTGIGLAVLLSFVVSSPSLRVWGDYFLITTFGFQVIAFSVLNNWSNVTHGPLGVPGIQRPRLLCWDINTNAEFAFVAGGMAVLACTLVWRITRSPFGRVLHAMREDDVFAKSLGKNTAQARVCVFAVSASMAATAGSLYAHYVTYIDPTSFTVNESILILAMVIVGGAGSRFGPILGAIVLVSLPEFLRVCGFGSAVAANLRQITYGTLLVLMMLFRPSGLIGRYSVAR